MNALELLVAQTVAIAFVYLVMMIAEGIQTFTDECEELAAGCRQGDTPELEVANA